MSPSRSGGVTSSIVTLLTWYINTSTETMSETRTPSSIPNRHAHTSATIASPKSRVRTRDIAINGRGFLVSNTAVDASGSYQLGRAGQLIGTTVTNGGAEELYLTDTTGAFILGWQADANGNFATGTTVANLVIAKVGADGSISLWNSNDATTMGPINLVIDIVGWIPSTGS